jgi:hypothetical protein
VPKGKLLGEQLIEAHAVPGRALSHQDVSHDALTVALATWRVDLFKRARQGLNARATKDPLGEPLGWRGQSKRLLNMSPDHRLGQTLCRGIDRHQGLLCKLGRCQPAQANGGVHKLQLGAHASSLPKDPNLSPHLELAGVALAEVEKTKACCP